MKNKCRLYRNRGKGIFQSKQLGFIIYLIKKLTIIYRINQLKIIKRKVSKVNHFQNKKRNTIKNTKKVNLIFNKNQIKNVMIKLKRIKPILFNRLLYKTNIKFLQNKINTINNKKILHLL